MKTLKIELTFREMQVIHSALVEHSNNMNDYARATTGYHKKTYRRQQKDANNLLKKLLKYE